MAKVLICGGPKYTNADRVFQVLDRAITGLNLTKLMRQDMKGVSSIAEGWATLHGIECLTYPESKAGYGKTGVPMMHDEIIREGEPDVVIAFPGNWATDDLVRKARAAHIRVYEIDRL